jgi:hypothetical protein
MSAKVDMKLEVAVLPVSDVGRKDPDGNLWVVQEVTARLPGRIDSNTTTFTSAENLASAMRRAEASTAVSSSSRRAATSESQNL